MIAQTTIDRVKSLPIDTVLSNFLTIKKGTPGNNLALCPFHDDHKIGSFVLYSKTDTFKCFSCGEQGDSISFVRKKLSLNFSDAVIEIAKVNGIQIDYENRQNGYTPEQYKAKQDEKENAYKALEFAQNHFTENTETSDNYLLNRQFSKDTIAAFGLGHADNNNFFTARNKELYLKIDLVKDKEGNKYDTFRNRITIPLNDKNGRLIGFAGRDISLSSGEGKGGTNRAKYINPTDTLLYQKGSFLYNLDKARTSIIKQDKVYLVEGYPNVWRMHQEGIYNVVAAGGTALTAEQIKGIKGSTKNIVLCYDGDNAGVKATNTNLMPLLKEGFNVSVLPMPTGMDIDDLGRYFHSFIPYRGWGNNLAEYIEYMKVTWLDSKISSFQQTANEDMSIEIQFVHHLADLILSYPDVTTQTILVEQAAKHYKSIKTSYKSKIKDKKESEKTATKDDVLKVISTETETLIVNARGILAPICNFKITLLYQLQIPNSEDCDWILELKKKGKEAEYLVLSNKDINSSKAMETAFYAKRYSIDCDDKQSRYLRAYLIEQGLKIAEKIETLGYHAESGLFFFSNVAYDTIKKQVVNPNNLAIIDLEKKGYFMPYTETDKSPKDKIACFYEESDITFDDVAEFVVKSWGEQEALSIAYYVATCYLDFIVKHTKNFPILFLKGPAGSGKSELAKLLMNFAGAGMGDKLSIGANSSTAAMKEFFSSYSNIPFHIEDYSRSGNLLELSDFLVLLYDRSFRKTMDMENRKSVKIMQPLSSCVISSNKAPLEDGSEALASRLIYLQMKVNARTPEHKVWFMNAKAKLMSKSWTPITTALLDHRHLIENNFTDYYVKLIDKLSNKLKAADYTVNDRIIASYSAIITPISILFEHEKVACFLPNHIDLKTALEDIAYSTIVRQHNSLVEKSPLQIFWDTVQMLFNDFKAAERQVNSYQDKNGYEQKPKVAYNPYLLYPEYHFSVWNAHVENGTPVINEPVIRLKLDDIYGRYVQRMKHLGLNPEKLNTIRDMMREHRSYDKDYSEKYIKFKKREGDESSATKKAFILKYTSLREDFGIDLE